MKVITLYVSILLYTGVSGQTQRIDSLLNDLKTAKNDSFAVFTLANLANEYYAYDTTKTNEYLAKGWLMAKKLGWHNALGNYYQNKGTIRQFASDHKFAEIYLDSAIYHFKKEITIVTDKVQIGRLNLFIATCLGQKADLLVNQGNGAAAVPVYLDALEKWRSSDQPAREEAVATYYSKISTVYYNLKQNDKALSYDKLALDAFLRSGNDEKIALAYLYVCDDFINLGQMDSCLVYLNLARPIITKLNNHRLNVQFHNKLGQISFKNNDYRTALIHFEKCVEEARITNSQFQVFSNQRMIGACYVRLGDYATARKYLLMALPQASEGRYARTKMTILQDLVTTEEKSNHPELAYTYMKEMIAIKDSLSLDESKKAIAEIEGKFQNAEKTKEIDKLTAEKKIQSMSIRQKSTLNYVLIGSLLASIVLGVLIYRNFRHRQQLAAVDSMMKGQEEERSRLAKDLHDGLGGMLSGVKFSLVNMKDNMIVTPDNLAVFERSLDMIDTSILELRRVAHNMMPEILLKFGLDEALKEYCNNVNATGLVQVKYQSHGLENKFEKSTEIIIYRIIQELLNNIMKHSGATEAFIQLIRENNRLNVVVEDNGRGFDLSKSNNRPGAGLANIRSRVDYLKGQLEIHTEEGKGTLVNIEFKV